MELEIKQVVDVLDAVAVEKTEEGKRRLLLANDCGRLRYLLKLAFDPYIVFGVKDFEVRHTETPVPTITEIRLLEMKLTSGEIRGNAAKSKIESTLSCCDEAAREVLSAIFKKDLSIGMAAKSLNLVFPGLIPTFELGLCETFGTEVKVPCGVEGEFTKRISEPAELPNGTWFVEPKFDGLRCICIINEDGVAEFFSREGRPLYNQEHVAAALKEIGVHSLVLDGEIFAGSWEESVSIAHSEKNSSGKKANKYYVFDIMSLNEWKEQCSRDGYVERKLALRGLEKLLPLGSPVECVSGSVVANKAEAKEAYQGYLRKGFEGAVLKKENSKYPFKRSTDWLKWKPSVTVDVRIVGWEEGKGRLKGTLGKFLVDHKGVIVGVSGFNDSLRKKFWAERESMLGKVIEVDSKGETPDGSLKSAQFKRLRLDKTTL